MKIPGQGTVASTMATFHQARGDPNAHQTGPAGRERQGKGRDPGGAFASRPPIVRRVTGTIRYRGAILSVPVKILTNTGGAGTTAAPGGFYQATSDTIIRRQMANRVRISTRLCTRASNCPSRFADKSPQSHRCDFDGSGVAVAGTFDDGLRISAGEGGHLMSACTDAFDSTDGSGSSGVQESSGCC